MQYQGDGQEHKNKRHGEEVTRMIDRERYDNTRERRDLIEATERLQVIVAFEKRLAKKGIKSPFEEKKAELMKKLENRRRG